MTLPSLGRAAPVAAAFCAALLLALLPGVAAAHVHLESSTPAAGANLDEPPGEVVLVFDGELDPDASRFTVTGPDGAGVGTGEADLTVAERDVLRGEVGIDEPGVYTVTYSVTGLDGHAVEGSLTFAYRVGRAPPAPTAAEDAGAAPDTAMAAPPPTDPWALGCVFATAAAAAVAGHRAVRRGPAR